MKALNRVLATAAWTLLSAASVLAGSSERDPTRPPEAARTAPPGDNNQPTADEGASLDQAQALQHRMVINGQPYLVERGWLRGVGDRLGKARIERIDDQAVWLRDDQGLHKLALYPQVDIRRLPSAAAQAAAAAARPPASHRHRPAAGADLKDTAP